MFLLNIEQSKIWLAPLHYFLGFLVYNSSLVGAQSVLPLQVVEHITRLQLREAGQDVGPDYLNKLFAFWKISI